MLQLVESIPIKDDFDRADGPLGNFWVSANGTGTLPTISGGKVIGPASGATPAVVRVADTYGPNCATRITVAGVDGVRGIGLALRARDAGMPLIDYYRFSFTDAGTVSINRVVDNVGTPLADSISKLTSVSIPPLQVGDVLAASAINRGDVAWLTAYVNGWPCMCAGDNALMDAGFAGFGIGNSTSEAGDDWGAVDIHLAPIADYR